MMPDAVVVSEGADDFGEHVRTDGLVERGPESTVGHHAELPRTAASLDSTVIRRRIRRPPEPDRKSTRLNSSHGYISYAVFCLKKKTLTNDFRQKQACTTFSAARRMRTSVDLPILMAVPHSAN